MVRRTKAEAQATRNSLLDAAEQLFQARGVSRTSLNDIAVAAGTTRGAIYWHFKDKADLFNAMMERVILPLEEAITCSSESVNLPGDPLLALRSAFIGALQKTATDEQTRRVFEVATHKVEYVDEMSAVRARHLKCRNDYMAMTQRSLEEAARRRQVRLPVPPQNAAMAMHVIMDGLLQNWLLDPDAFDLAADGEHMFDAYLAGIGLPVQQPAAPAARPEHALA